MQIPVNIIGCENVHAHVQCMYSDIQQLQTNSHYPFTKFYIVLQNIIKTKRRIKLYIYKLATKTSNLYRLELNNNYICFKMMI